MRSLAGQRQYPISPRANSKLHTRQPARALRQHPYPAFTHTAARRLPYKHPIASPVLCKLIHNDKALTLTLDDISTSGLGAFDDDQVLDLSPGHLYQNCSVNLPGVGLITVNLRVAYSE